MAAIDESFKRPGSVPFRWEIRPGVPKIHYHQQQQQGVEEESPPKLQQKKLSPPMLPQKSFNLSSSSSPKPVPVPEHRLKPPPPSLVTNTPFHPRTHSFPSAPRTRFDRWQWQVDQPKSRVQPECVSPGCFPASPIVLKRTGSMKKLTLIARVLGTKQVPNSHHDEPEDESSSDVDTLSQRSVCSRRSLSMSPFRDSPPLSYSPSSYRLSARPVNENDSEWAGFGLF